MRYFTSFLAGAMIVALSTVCCAETGTTTQAARTAVKSAAKQTVPAVKIDLNTAAQKDLEKLPGIGPANAKKIIAGRPYASSADLAKAGIPAGTINKIAPLVSVGALPSTLPKTPKTPHVAGQDKIVKPATPPPAGKNMVWVNTESKIYHKPDSFWYGKTKNGSYMTESAAIKSGYRAEKAKTKQGR